MSLVATTVTTRRWGASAAIEGTDSSGGMTGGGVTSLAPQLKARRSESESSGRRAAIERFVALVGAMRQAWYQRAVTDVPPLLRFVATLPRHAFSARNAARAGDVWRSLQEVAVEASTRVGWAPMRYRAEGSAFVMRTMTVDHVREARYGEALEARTWVHPFKRGIFSTREIRIHSAEDGSRIATATQQWVHVNADMKPARAGEELTAAFVPHDEPGDPGAELPAVATPVADPRTHRFELTPWFTSMDPLDHVNHPAYVDFCDEALARIAHGAGIAPLGLRPRAEKLTYSRGLGALEAAVVETRLRGRSADGAVVCEHEVLLADGTRCARGTTVRDLAEGSSDGLAEALA